MFCFFPSDQTFIGLIQLAIREILGIILQYDNWKATTFKKTFLFYFMFTRILRTHFCIPSSNPIFYGEAGSFSGCSALVVVGSAAVYFVLKFKDCCFLFWVCCGSSGPTRYKATILFFIAQTAAAATCTGVLFSCLFLLLHRL